MVSSKSYVWFGIPGKAMQWVPAPKAGFQRNWTGNVETLALEDGRQAINVSAQKRTQYVGDFFGDYTNPDGVDIDVFNAYASGFYGRGPIIFANPYAFTQNLFAPHWATPSLVEQGWSPQTSVDLSMPVVFGTSAASSGRPTRYALYTINTTPYAATSSANQFNQYIPIPPGYTLYVGASGQYGGNGAIVVQPFLASDNSTDSVTVLDMLDPTGSVQTNASFDGGTYNAVRVFLTRTARTDDSSIMLFSMMAQLIPSGRSLPPIAHAAGQGNLGLKIVGSAIAETYNYGGIQKGLNLTLEEVI